MDDLDIYIQQASDKESAYKLGLYVILRLNQRIFLGYYVTFREK